MPDQIIDAATSGNVVLLLAIIVIVLGSVVGTLAVVIYRELRSRITRAERLTDKMVEAFDALGPATKHAAEVSEAALEELRTAFSRRRSDK